MRCFLPSAEVSVVQWTHKILPYAIMEIVGELEWADASLPVINRRKGGIQLVEDLQSLEKGRGGLGIDQTTNDVWSAGHRSRVIVSAKFQRVKC